MSKYLLALLACLALQSVHAQAPNTLAGLRLWLDASDPNGNGIAPGNGSAITVWTDKSGTGSNAVAVGGGGMVVPVYHASAIGTAGTISFDRNLVNVAGYTVPGLDIRAAVRPDVTIFTVYRQGGTPNLGTQALWGNDNGGWDRMFFSRLNGNDGAVSRGATVAPFTVDIPGAGTAGLVRLVTTIYDGNVSGGVNNGVDNGSAVYFNGQLVSTTSDFTSASDAQTALRIGYDGDDNFFQGEIAEMIVYDRKLTGCEIQTVNRYLSDKYGQVYKFPTVTPDGATTVCAGGFVVMYSSMLDGNEWQSSANGTTWTTIPGETGQLYTATASGFYRVRICGNEASSPIAVTVTPQASANFSYPGAPFCPSGTAAPTLTGTSGGTWTSTAGLSINATTGVIDLAASTPGTYTVTYTVAAAGGCSQVQATSIVGIHPTATLNQPLNATACAGASTTLATFAGTGSSYTWTNNNTATGLAASGTGNIAPFTATNGSTAPITSAITVTPVGAGLQGFAYVPNNGANSVSVINIATGATVAIIPTAGEPFAVAVLPDRSKVFVSTVTGNRVEVITTATNAINQNAPFNAPHGLVASPDGSRVYVNGWGGGGAVSYINTANPTSSTFMTNVTNPEGMAITPDGSTLYVASAVGGLVAINTTTNIPTFVAAGTNPHGVVITPNGRFVYTANNGSDNVTVVNTSTNAVAATIPVGDAPLGIAVSPDGTKIYVANSGSNNVSVISTASNTVTATISAGTYPFGVAVSPDGARVFVTNQNSNNLSVIDAATNSVTTTYATGTKPIGIGNFLAATYTCNGAPKTFTLTVNPKPSWNNGGFSTSICNNQGIGLSISNGGTVPGADYSWTLDNPAIGADATGSGPSLTFTGTNTGLANISGLFTVTPSYTNNGVTCAGNPNTFTITVKPSPRLSAGTVNSVSCNGGANGTATVLATGGSGPYTYSWFPSGGTAATASGLMAGTYTVTVTNNGCFSSRPFTINQPAALTATSSQTNVLCNGGSTGTASVQVSGGTAPYTYAWSPSGGTAATATGLPVGNYTVTIKDANLCQVTRNFTITQPAALTVAAGPQVNADCGATGSASVTASGGTAPYTYAWSPGGGNAASATGLSAGTYTATVTDANGCTGTQAFTITGTPGPTVDAVTNQTVCAGTNTTAVTFSGTAGATFNWTNSNPAIGLGASGSGNISSFTAVNNGNAPVTATVTVTPVATANLAYVSGYSTNKVYVVNLPDNSIVASIPTGSNGPTTMVKTPDGSKIFVGHLSGNIAVISTATNSVVATITYPGTLRGLSLSNDGSKLYVANLGSTILRVYSTNSYALLSSIDVGAISDGIFLSPDGSRLLVTHDAANMTVINTTTEAVSTFLTGTLSTGAVFSPSGNKLFVANYGAGTVTVHNPVTYSITKTINVGGTPFRLSVSPDGSRIYVSNFSNNSINIINAVTETLISSTTGIPGSVESTVSADGTTVFAGGIDGTGLYKIDAATGTQLPLVNLSSSTFAVLLTNGTVSCTGTPKTFTITVNPAPTASISYAGTPYCTTGTASPTFSGTTGGTYSSTTGLSINSSTGVIDLAASTPGSYTVTYTIAAANGCSQVTTTASVTIQSNAAITQPGNQTVCGGSATSAVTFSGTNGSGFTWTNNTPGIGLAASGTGNIPAFTAVNNSGAPVTATVTVSMSANAGFCAAAPKTFTITVSPQRTASFSYAGSPYCSGPGTASPTFTGTAGGSYSSTTGLSINSSTGAVDIAASTPGTYTVTYTIAAAGVCPQVTASTSLTINPPVTATITASGPTTLCPGGSVTLSAPAVPGATYLWSNGATTSGINVTAAGSYSVTVTSNGCVANGGPVTVSMNPAPTVNAIVSQNLCNGANTTAVTFSGSVPGTVYNWTNNTTSIGLAASGSGNIASFAAVNNGTAAVTALVTITPSYTAGGTTCPGTAASFSITVNPTPTVNTVASQVLCNGAGSTAVNFSGAVANTAYTWTNNNPSIGLAPSGSGNIASFTAVNNGTAPVTATITVTPQATLSGRAYVPNNTSGTVSMIDLSTGAAIGSPITVGANPFGAAVLPDRSKIYVSNTGGNSVSVINTSTNTVTGTSPYNAPHGLAASPDGTRVYVNGWTDNAVSWIDAVTNGSTFMTNVTQPEGMAVSADGARLYVASSVNPGKLVVINTASNAVIASINVGAFPQGVALSADGSKVYVVNNGSASVSVISTASNGVTATIPVGADPLGVAVSPDGSKVYVTNSGNNNVSVINTATNALTASIAVGNYPYGVAVSPDGSTVYVANRNSNSVSVINAATNAVTSVAVGAAPIALGQFTTASLQCAGTPKTFTITVNPTPVVNAVNGQTLCAGAATTAVSFSGAVPGTVYNWTNNNTSIGLAASGTGNIASFTAVNATATVQTATVTVTPSFTSGGQTCTGAPVTFTITVNPTPAATPVSSQVLCNGSATAAVSFSGPVSGTTYSWTNSNTSIGLAGSGTGNIASFTAVNSSSTVQVATITVTPSAAGCPGAAQTFTITVNPTPSVNAVTNQSLCNGANTTAIAFGGSVAGAVYNWTNNTASIGLAAAGSGNIASFAAVNNSNAAVTATVTVTPSFSNGGQTCAGTPSTFTITVNPTPSVAAIAGQAVCNGAATTAVNFNGAVSGTTYSWTNSTPSIGLAATGTGDIASFTATNSTSAPVTATITVTPSAAGCAGSVQTFTITVNPTAVVNAVTPVTVCAGQVVSVPGFSGSISGTQFSWTNDNTAIGLGASGNGNIAPFTAVNNGTTPVVANVTVTPTANGCAGTPVSFTITVNPLPGGTITAPNGTLLCAGGSTQLQASGGTSYQWFLGGNPIPGATGATFNAITAGTYTVDISNGFGCTRAASNSIVLTLVQKPTADFTFNSYCVNTPVQFTNTTGTGGSGTVTYQWSFGNGQNSTLQHPAATYGATGNYTVQLIASPNGCTSLNDTVQQTIRIEAPLPGQRLATQDVVSGRATELHARNLPNGRYSWTPATGLSNPSIWYPVATLTQQQEYRIQVAFASGCVTVDTLLVRIQKGDDIFVPSAFSPDGDGVNDVLKPITVGLTTFRYFRVYDQLGREVFASTAINQGWDGRYKGQPLRADTYIWVAEGRDSSGNIIRRNGQVVLMR